MKGGRLLLGVAILPVVACHLRPGEPMTAPPSVGKTMSLAARDGELVESPPREPQKGGDLLARIAGPEWRVVRLIFDGRDFVLAPDGVPTFAADETGKVQGLATINRYFGRLLLGGDGRFRWEGPLGSTRMAGPEPLMEQERAFLQALQAANRLEVREGRLILQDGKGETALEFRR